jgi:hypothetical protein
MRIAVKLKANKLGFLSLPWANTLPSFAMYQPSDQPVFNPNSTKRFNTMKTLIQTMTFACVLLFAGCVCEFDQPTKTYVGEEGARHHRILASEFGQVMIDAEDTLSLEFSCPPVLPALPAGLSGKVMDNTAMLWREPMQPNTNARSTPNLSTGTFQLNFAQPVYAVKLSTPVEFLPGDANADGERNILDLYPIARVIWEHGGGIDWDIPNFVPLSGQLDTNATYTRPATELNWTWNNTGADIDLVHADCNFDGTVDMRDVEFLEKVLEPSQLPDMLKGAYSNLQLEAVRQPRMEFYNDEVRTWYDIQITGLAPNASQKILGVVFSRPVDEIRGDYQVLHIQASMEDSDLFDNKDGQMISIQHFWDDIDIDFVSDTCQNEDAVACRPLDVGAFNRTGPRTLQNGHKCISCGVTIDDVLGSVQAGGPIFQHFINVVIFSLDADDNIVATTTSCSFDAITIEDTGIKDTTYTSPPADWWSEL